MSTRLVCVHLGVVPVNAIDWTDEIPAVASPAYPYPVYDGSFREWGEPVMPGDHGEPHAFTLDLDAHVEPGHENCTGASCLSRDALEEVTARAREYLDDLLPPDWRLVDYVVVTDVDDHSDGARTVGMWGA